MRRFPLLRPSDRSLPPPVVPTSNRRATPSFSGFEVPHLQAKRIDRQRLPGWVRWSLVANAVGVVVLAGWLARPLWPADWTWLEGDLPAWTGGDRADASANSLDEGSTHPQSYPQWVRQRAREAEQVVRQRPVRLAVLAGDSLSQAFPRRLLPRRFIWLNQGISGETTRGLLDRLDDFDGVSSEAIFVAIGINDALRGIRDAEILDNQRAIVRHLRRHHPRARIVLQGLLPHRAAAARWEGRDRLRRAPNARLRALNGRLARLAREEGAIFLDLHPMFTDATGKLAEELTTDGLHLSERGYRVWQAAIETFAQLYLDSPSSRQRPISRNQEP